MDYLSQEIKGTSNVSLLSHLTAVIQTVNIMRIQFSFLLFIVSLFIAHALRVVEDEGQFEQPKSECLIIPYLIPIFNAYPAVFSPLPLDLCRVYPPPWRYSGVRLSFYTYYISSIEIGLL